jgi:hypothetical protein
MYEAALSEPEHWFALVSTVDDTDVISNERLAIDHREWIELYGEVQGDAFFRQQYFCEFDAPILGAVYADALKYIEAEGRICPLKIEPGVPVHTGWDLGVGDSTAIWFIQLVAIIIWLTITRVLARHCTIMSMYYTKSGSSTAGAMDGTGSRTMSKRAN